MLTITTPLSSSPVFKAHTFFAGSNYPVVLLKESSFGTCNLKTQALQIADISAFMADFNFPEETLLTLGLTQPALMLFFTLSGYLNIDGHTTGSFVLREQAHFMIPVMANSELTVYVSGEAKLFVVCFYGDVLPRLFSEEEQLILQGKLAGNTWRTGRPISYPMEEIISSVMQCANNHCLHQIFMAAKMLELLFISVDQLKYTGGAYQPASSKTKDLEKLEQAKQVIKENLRQPYSLIELAHKVGLNDFKLKKGFRETFGNTVFGYLLDVRMERAAAMLCSGNYKVSEVAHEVGYKNAHHFSVAFKKKFGYLPSKVAVNSAGYYA